MTPSLRTIFTFDASTYTTSIKSLPDLPGVGSRRGRRQRLVNIGEESERANFDTHWNPCLARLQHGANCNIKSIELRIRKARKILAREDKSQEEKYEQHCLIRLILEDRFIVLWDLERKVQAMTLGNYWQTKLGSLDSVGQEVDKLYEKEKWSETELLEGESRCGLPCGEHARRRRALD